MPKPSIGLFTADTHLESYQYNLQEREDDFVRALEDTAKRAVSDEAIRFVALLGDTTNVKLECRQTQKVLRKIIQSITDTGRRVYTLRGNHDPEEIALAEIFGLDFLQDAEQAMLQCLERNLSFQPYGSNGPRVCAVGYLPTEALLAYLKRIRETEETKGLPRSTELWLHAAIRPGAPDVASDLDVETLHALGWHTVVAGDIHNGGLWTKPNGILIYPGSKEMTDINEDPEKKGEYLHQPDDEEKEPTPNAWQFVPYNQGRPYRLFNFVEGIDEKALKEITDWTQAAQARTGLKPVIAVCTTDTGKELLRSPEVAKLALRLNIRRPKREETPQAQTETVERQALRGRSLEEGLLLVAEKKNLKPRTREILQKVLNPQVLHEA